MCNLKDFFVIVAGVQQADTSVDYADDIALQANTPGRAGSLIHRLDQVSGGIGLHVNADESKYVCFNQGGNTFTLNGGFLKLVDKFIYLGSSISTTENYINSWLVKAIDKLLVIWKSHLSDKIRRSFSSRNRVHTILWMHLFDAD